MFSFTSQKLKVWSIDKNPWIRMPILVWFGYLLYRYGNDPLYQDIILGNFNLGLHEAGHYVIFAFFGEFMHFLGGSLFECVAPLIGAFSFWRQGQYFAISFCLAWLGTALFSTATYISDAQERSLELLFGEHDWHYLLTQMGYLQYDDQIGSVVRFLAFASMFFSLAYGAWLIGLIFKNKDLNTFDISKEV